MAAGLELTCNASEIRRVAKLLRQAGPKAPLAIKRAINQTGDRATTVMVRALTKQTGLPRKTIVKALKKTRAGHAFTIRSAGGDVSLKYFGARETGSGVSAAPWGKRRIYRGTFQKGGRFPNRVAVPSLGGQVWMRTGGSRLPIEKLKSGLFIPDEMVTGATEAAFFEVVEAELPSRLEAELLRVFD